MSDRSASLAIRQAFSKPCLVNFISKDTHLVRVFSISCTDMNIPFVISSSLTFFLKSLGFYFRIKYHKIWSQFTCSLSFKEWNKATKILKVQRVMATRGLFSVSNHRAEQSLRAWRWGAHKLSQLERVRNVAL